MRKEACFIIVVAAMACGRSSSPPPQSPVTAERVPLAVIADSLFWRTFHAGAYDQIPRAMRLLKAAYLQNPFDHRTAAHIGYLHAWQATERARLDSVPPEITDHAILARKYFDQASARGGGQDPRLLGFGAVLQMSEGAIHRDETLSADGLARGRRAIEAWPEFNWFTVGYVLSARPDTSALFHEGLEMQWKTIAACSRRAVDRADPRPEVTLAAQSTEMDARRLRACWNSWIAPHNVEGFFLNMGDMLVKAGDWRTAQKIYRHAQEINSYSSWPFRGVLEERIRDAERNVPIFRRASSETRPRDEPVIMLRSPFACTACHQARSP
jgi:hypothetical protein